MVLKLEIKLPSPEIRFSDWPDFWKEFTKCFVDPINQILERENLGCMFDTRSCAHTHLVLDYSFHSSSSLMVCVLYMTGDAAIIDYSQGDRPHTSGHRRWENALRVFLDHIEVMVNGKENAEAILKRLKSVGDQLLDGISAKLV